LEREAEVAALTAVLGAARGGDGRLVVVEGSAGIGKTRLLGEARELAREGDFAVLAARGGELEGEFAFGIVRQLFEPAQANGPLRRRLRGGQMVRRRLVDTAPFDFNTEQQQVHQRPRHAGFPARDPPPGIGISLRRRCSRSVPPTVPGSVHRASPGVLCQGTTRFGFQQRRRLSL